MLRKDHSEGDLIRRPLITGGLDIKDRQELFIRGKVRRNIWIEYTKLFQLIS